MMKMTMMIEQSMKEKLTLSGTGISSFSTTSFWYVFSNSILRCMLPLGNQCYHKSDFDF